MLISELTKLYRLIAVVVYQPWKNICTRPLRRSGNRVSVSPHFFFSVVLNASSFEDGCTGCSIKLLVPVSNSPIPADVLVQRWLKSTNQGTFLVKT